MRGVGKLPPVARKLLKQQKAVEKVIARVDKAFSKNQPSTGTKNLIPQGEEPGLIQEVRDQVKALKEDGTIPETAPNRLLAKLLGLACQGYYDVSTIPGYSSFTANRPANPHSPTDEQQESQRLV